MRIPIFQVDAFATGPFTGNPAAVMLMEVFPDNAVLLSIAAENNLSETAFLVAEGSDYRLRWFTPRVEVPLCGHATLAAGAVVMERLQPGRVEVAFQTASGLLTVRRGTLGYVMDLPARSSEVIPTPIALSKALGGLPSRSASIFLTTWRCLKPPNSSATSLPTWLPSRASIVPVSS